MNFCQLITYVMFFFLRNLQSGNGSYFPLGGTLSMCTHGMMTRRAIYISTDQVPKEGSASCKCSVSSENKVQLVFKILNITEPQLMTFHIEGKLLNTRSAQSLYIKEPKELKLITSGSPNTHKDCIIVFEINTRYTFQVNCSAPTTPTSPTTITTDPSQGFPTASESSQGSTANMTETTVFWSTLSDLQTTFTEDKEAQPSSTFTNTKEQEGSSTVWDTSTKTKERNYGSKNSVSQGKSKDSENIFVTLISGISGLTGGLAVALLCTYYCKRIRKRTSRNSIVVHSKPCHSLNRKEIQTSRNIDETDTTQTAIENVNKPMGHDDENDHLSDNCANYDCTNVLLATKGKQAFKEEKGGYSYYDSAIFTKSKSVQERNVYDHLGPVGDSDLSSHGVYNIVGNIALEAK